ncbi:hypothetical protein CVT24_000399 [Panaeolus cyanescens]|uniref:Uncharacterized protein n=1 Tax=Panaeolus cyanescens TaxID=181874 RepID=A0A409YDK7_9AGAR|nr:hypothetical protein CVT24_000399 [Panaeolus cyanescens]
MFADHIPSYLELENIFDEHLYDSFFNDLENIALDCPIPSHVTADSPFSMEDTKPPSPPMLLHRTEKTRNRVSPYPSMQERYQTAEAVDTANITQISSSLSASVEVTEAEGRGSDCPRSQNRRKAAYSEGCSQPPAKQARTGGSRHRRRRSGDVESPSSSSSSSSPSPSIPSMSVFSAASPASSTTSVSSSTSTCTTTEGFKNITPSDRLGPQEPDTRQGTQQRHMNWLPRTIAKRKPRNKSPQ